GCYAGDGAAGRVDGSGGGGYLVNDFTSRGLEWARDEKSACGRGEIGEDIGVGGSSALALSTDPAGGGYAGAGDVLERGAGGACGGGGGAGPEGSVVVRLVRAAGVGVRGTGAAAGAAGDPGSEPGVAGGAGGGGEDRVRADL